MARYGQDVPAEIRGPVCKSCTNMPWLPPGSQNVVKSVGYHKNYEIEKQSDKLKYAPVGTRLTLRRDSSGHWQTYNAIKMPASNLQHLADPLRRPQNTFSTSNACPLVEGFRLRGLLHIFLDVNLLHTGCSRT